MFAEGNSVIYQYCSAFIISRGARVVSLTLLYSVHEKCPRWPDLVTFVFASMTPSTVKFGAYFLSNGLDEGEKCPTNIT
jgi:hypothetical protein